MRALVRASVRVYGCTEVAQHAAETVGAVGEASAIARYSNVCERAYGDKPRAGRGIGGWHG